MAEHLDAGFQGGPNRFVPAEGLNCFVNVATQPSQVIPTIKQIVTPDLIRGLASFFSQCRRKA